MSYASDRLREFHDAFEVHVPDRNDSGQMITTATQRLRLHDEEHLELRLALKAIPELHIARGPGQVRQEKLEAIVEELADVMVVAYGTADLLGIDLDVAFRLKMDANFAKLPDCERCHGAYEGPRDSVCPRCNGTGKGQPLKREDGKILKGEGWQKPSMAEAIK